MLRDETKSPNCDNLHILANSIFLFQSVTHLLNTAGLETEPDCVKPNLEELERRGIKVLTLRVNDRAFVGINEHFSTSGAWIREALQGGGRVLVNCFQGASRWQFYLFLSTWTI